MNRNRRRRAARAAGRLLCLAVLAGAWWLPGGPGTGIGTGTGIGVLQAQAAVQHMPDGGYFDAAYYAAANPDVVAAKGTDPEELYLHYVMFGSKEGRLPFAAETTPADLAAAPDYERPGRTPLMQDGITYHEVLVDNDSATFTFAGDINMDPGFVAGQTIRRKGLAGCFDQAALNAMRGSDVFMLNNEFTYSTNSNKNNKRWTFQARPQDAAMLKDIGTDIVSLANNHTYDYMKAGFLSTMNTLDGIGMPYVGAGRNSQEAEEPCYYLIRSSSEGDEGNSSKSSARGGMTVAIVAATEIERTPNPATKAATTTEPGVFHAYDPTRLYQVIRDAKTKADYVIAFVHWGTEQRATPDARQLQLGQGMVDAGVDLIIGDHSHCQETIGWIGDVPVIYSLGNYVFANYTKDTCLVRVTLQPSEGRMTKIEYLPLRCRTDCTVYTPTGAERTAALAREQAISPNVNIAADGTITPKR